MILKNNLGSLLKSCNSLSLTLQYFLHLLLPFLHIFTDLFERLLLPLYQTKAQLKYFCKVGPKVFPKSFLVTLNSIIGVCVFLNLLIFFLVSIITFPLQLQLLIQISLNFKSLFACLQLFVTNTITPVIKKPIIRTNLILSHRFTEKLRELLKRITLDSLSSI